MLENEELYMEVLSFGAELQSVKDKKTKFEYLWQGDKNYWSRRSPILFPIVGKVWDGRMRYQGSEYLLSQHGFARDLDFDFFEIEKLNEKYNLKYSSVDTLAFVLHSDDVTRRIYPFDFSLYIIYQLDGRSIKVNWLVENKTDGDIYFQIGAHPAFNYYDYDLESPIQGYIKFDKEGEISLTCLECGGYASKNRRVINVAEDGIAITKETFAGDALVIEKQVSKVSLCNRQGKPYVEVVFAAPVVGLWSPSKLGYAPFMCIEPWYGRCDDSYFLGDYNEKPYINFLEKDGIFCSTYVLNFM